jgi:hypothetical protein
LDGIVKGFLINKKTDIIMKKKSKKIKDKTPYDPDSSHNFLFFQMVGPNKSCSGFPPAFGFPFFYMGFHCHKKTEIRFVQKTGAMV